MSSTNKTTYYELSQYVGSDKPTYLGDYNSDMLKIDTGLHTAADAADTALTTANTANSAATSASTTASTALSTAQTASSTASQAQTTAETALTNAGAAQTAATNAETAARANTITNLAPAYDATLTYDVGNLVTYIDSQGSGKLYKCIVAVTTPEAFNINKWDDVTTSEVFESNKTLLKSITSDGVLTISEILATLLSDINPYSDGIYSYSVITKSDVEVREFTLSNAVNDTVNDGNICFTSHFGFYNGSGYSDLTSTIGVRHVNNVLTGYQFAFRANYTGTGTVTPTHVIYDYSPNVDRAGDKTYYLYK